MSLPKPLHALSLIFAVNAIILLVWGCTGAVSDEGVGGDPFANLPVIEITDSIDITDNGTEEFFFRSRYFYDMAIAGNGNLIIFNNGAPNIYHFSNEGDFLANIGREGDGPGEFRRGSGYSFDMFGSDTLYVLENASWSVHAFARNRETNNWKYENGFNLEKRPDLRPTEIHQLDDTRLGIVYGPGSRHMFLGNSTYDELSNTVQTISTGGKTYNDSLITTPVNQFTKYRSSLGGAALIFPPYGMKSILDTGPAKSLYHVVTDTFLIHIYGPGGKALNPIRQSTFTRDLSEDLREAAVEAEIGVNMGSDEENRKMKDKVFEELPLTAPPLKAMHVDRDTGHIIVRRDSVYTGPNWLLMDRDGKRLGVLSTDPDMHVYDFRAGTIIGSVIEEEGLPTVRIVKLAVEGL